MKVAAVVIGGLLLVALTVYVVGALLTQSHRVSRSALYRVPPERLFALIDGPQDWRPDITQSETLTDAAGRRSIRETHRDGNTITYDLQQSPSDGARGPLINSALHARQARVTPPVAVAPRYTEGSR